MKRSYVVRIAFVSFAMILAAAAQTGLNRWSSVKGFGFGYVDRSTLANHFEIPIYTRATVGNAQINLALAYNSNFWAYGQPFGFGWSLEKPFGTLTENEDEYDQYCGWWNDNNGDYDEWFNLIVDTFTFTEPDGSSPAGNVATSEYLGAGGGRQQRGDENDCPSVSGLGPVVQIPDGKGYSIVISGMDFAGATAQAFDSKGDEVDGLLKDPNGNEVTITTSGGDTYYHDPLGNDTGGHPALTQSGSGTPASPVEYTFTGANGSQTSITEKFAAQTVSYSDCSRTWSGTPDLPSEIDLPDGRKYTFGYDGYGRVTSVTLPTGATISYAYTQDCTDWGNSALSRSDSVSPSGGDWSWARAQQGSGAVKTTETDPTSNNGVFSFAAPYWLGEGGALTEADFYNGSVSSSNEIESIAYSNTLSVNFMTGQGLTYELYSAGSPVLWRQQQSSYSNGGQTLYQYEYDWGSCLGCGALLRNITTSYTTFLDGTMSEPAEVTVSPNTGSGGQIAQTNYSYDGSTGNLLNVHDYVNSSTYLTKSFTYFANGTVHTSTDTNGGVTTYTYATGSGGCADPNGVGIFPTTIQSPITAVKTTETWNCVGGVPVTSTDGNSNTTTYYYADPANTWRPSSMEDAAGNTGYLYYPTSGSPNTSERKLTFNSGNSISDVVSIVDGLGQPVLSQSLQGPSSSNYNTVQTCYDGMGRPYFVTAPYSGTSGHFDYTTCPSAATSDGTYTVYDALSRPSSVTNGVGGTMDYSYTKNDVLSTLGPAPAGENTKQKQDEFDGLGRLTSVCELTTGSGSGTCSQSASQTGYWAKYTRDALGNITGVTQNAQGASTESRSSSFDWLGRLTAETNPETNTTDYYFDTDTTCGTSDGDMVKRVDANGNTTCYAYDAAHRVTGISYPSGPNSSYTLAKYFTYDAATYSGTPMANAVGHLARAYTGSGATTDLYFSYTSLGQTAETWEATPNMGYTTASATYYPNGAVDTLTAPGAPAITYALDGMGRAVGVTTSGTPATLVNTSGTNYDVTGLRNVKLGSGDTDAFTFDANTGRMTQYVFTVGSQTDTGTLAWQDDGQMSSLAIVNNITGTGDSQSCTYSHDDLARLAGVNCGSHWGQTFSYDPFGNLAKSATTGTSFSASFNLANRISSVSSFTPNYDSNGNLLDDPVAATRSVNVYDSENKPVTFEGITVVYDALGRAVQADLGSGDHEFVYGPGGGKLAVMNGSTAVETRIPLPGGGEAVYQGGSFAFYRHVGARGSSRVASTQSQTLYSATAYAPFGEAYNEAGTQDRSFTGQKQDIASNQYDFMMREYSSVQSRWWTPDPSGKGAANPENPQSFNRYAYVNGMPLAATDPLGLMWKCIPSAQLDAPGNANRIATTSSDFGPQDGDGDNSGMVVTSSSDADSSDCVGLGGSPEFGWTIMDGADVPPGMGGAGGAFASEGDASGLGSAFTCPTASCAEIGTDPYTGWANQYLQFTGDAAGNSGSMSILDNMMGLYGMNGGFMTGVDYQIALDSSPAASSQIAAAAAALVSQGKLSADDAEGWMIGQLGEASIGAIPIGGGNLDFGNANAFFSSGECANNRCDEGALGSLDYSHLDGTFHLDTVDPYASFGDLLTHFFIDVVGGHSLWYVIPRG